MSHSEKRRSHECSDLLTDGIACPGRMAGRRARAAEGPWTRRRAPASTARTTWPCGGGLPRTPWWGNRTAAKTAYGETRVPASGLPAYPPTARAGGSISSGRRNFTTLPVPAGGIWERAGVPRRHRERELRQEPARAPDGILGRPGAPPGGRSEEPAACVGDGGAPAEEGATRIAADFTRGRRRTMLRRRAAKAERPPRPSRAPTACTAPARRSPHAGSAARAATRVRMVANHKFGNKDGARPNAASDGLDGGYAAIRFAEAEKEREANPKARLAGAGYNNGWIADIITSSFKRPPGEALGPANLKCATTGRPPRWRHATRHGTPCGRRRVGANTAGRRPRRASLGGPGGLGRVRSRFMKRRPDATIFYKTQIQSYCNDYKR